jgi:hypothetical protein
VAGSVPVVIVAAGRRNQREPEHGESVRTLSPNSFCPPTLPPQNRRGKSREDRVSLFGVCGPGFSPKRGPGEPPPVPPPPTRPATRDVVRRRPTAEISIMPSDPMLPT